MKDTGLTRGPLSCTKTSKGQVQLFQPQEVEGPIKRLPHLAW